MDALRSQSAINDHSLPRPDASGHGAGARNADLLDAGRRGVNRGKELELVGRITLI